MIRSRESRNCVKTVLVHEKILLSTDFWNGSDATFLSHSFSWKGGDAVLQSIDGCEQKVG